MLQIANHFPLDRVPVMLLILDCCASVRPPHSSPWLRRGGGGGDDGDDGVVGNQVILQAKLTSLHQIRLPLQAAPHR